MHSRLAWPGDCGIIMSVFSHVVWVLSLALVRKLPFMASMISWLHTELAFNCRMEALHPFSAHRCWNEKAMVLGKPDEYMCMQHMQDMQIYFMPSASQLPASVAIWMSLPHAKDKKE